MKGYRENLELYWTKEFIISEHYRDNIKIIAMKAGEAQAVWAVSLIFQLSISESRRLVNFIVDGGDNAGCNYA